MFSALLGADCLPELVLPPRGQPSSGLSHVHEASVLHIFVCVLCKVLTSKGQHPWRWLFPGTLVCINKKSIQEITRLEALGCGLRHIFKWREVFSKHLIPGRLIGALILRLTICLLCSMLIERTIDRNLPFLTDLYHIYLPQPKHVCTSLIAARVDICCCK